MPVVDAQNGRPFALFNLAHESGWGCKVGELGREEMHQLQSDTYTLATMAEAAVAQATELEEWGRTVGDGKSALRGLTESSTHMLRDIAAGLRMVGNRLDAMLWRLEDEDEEVPV